MAECTLTMNISRRAMLAGGSAAVLFPTAALPASAGAGDARIATLAADYIRVSTALTDLVTEAECRHGLFAYEEPPYKDRCDALAGYESRIIELLARARPNSLKGIALKVHAAFYGEAIRDNLDCDTRIMAPALRDLLRLAAHPPGVNLL